MTHDLDIVIVSFNTRDGSRAPACASLYAAAPAGARRGSSSSTTPRRDGSVDAVRAALAGGRGDRARRQPRVRAREQRRHPARPPADCVLLLNSDTSCPPGAIDALVARLDAHAARSPPARGSSTAAGRPELSFGPMISPLAELRQQALASRAGRRDRRRRPRYVERLTRRERDVDWVSGACLLCGATRPRPSGLLDERYFLYDRGRGLLRRAARARRARSCSRRRPRSCTCAAARGRRPRGRERVALRPQPPRVLREAPPGWAPLAARAGCGCAGDAIR